MKKETLLEIILGTVGGLIFAVGMCMCLIPEWNLFAAGVVVAVVGFIVLLCIIPVFDNMKKFIKKIFVPNALIGFVAFNFGMALLIYVFSAHLENTTLAYVSYLASTYALIIFCVWFYKSSRTGSEAIRTKSVAYKFYKTNSQKFAKISLSISFLANFIYGTFKLAMGIYYKSAWFITFAVYYLLLCTIRGSLIKAVHRKNFGSDVRKEYEKMKHTGMTLLILDVVLAGMVILIMRQGRTISYPGYVIYLVALYDFYIIITAFINVFKHRHETSPILAASKCVNLTVAMIMMISLEVAMMTHFGRGDEIFRTIVVSCTGLGVCAINSFMAIWLILKSDKSRTNLNRS